MGLITCIIASPGQGKTQTLMRLVGKRPCIYFVSSAANKNQDFQKIAWGWGNEYVGGDPQVRQAMANQVRLVMLPEEAPDLLPYFTTDEWKDWCFAFDDYTTLFDGPYEMRSFKKFVASVRHRDGEIFLTNYRLQGEVVPYVRGSADKIYQIGPLYSREDARDLYGVSSGRDRSFKEFYARISSTERFKTFAVRDIELVIGETPKDKSQKLELGAAGNDK